QQQVATIVNALMTSPEWKDSVFFFSYDEGGGPYDHVPPVPNHTNDFTDAAQLTNYPTHISSIAVSPDSYNPCLPPNPPGTPTTHCDLAASDPGASPTDVAAVQGFAASSASACPTSWSRPSSAGITFLISPWTTRRSLSSSRPGLFQVLPI